MHYERGYAYPLLIWLHSQGGSELEIRQVLPEISLRNYVGIAPRGTELADSDAASVAGWNQTIDVISEAERCVKDCVDIAAAKFNIARNRIFLAGIGTGGTMALRVAFRHANDFAGVISIGGHLPTGEGPLREIDRIRQLPILLLAAQQGDNYSEARMCRDLRLLHSIGGNVDLRQYLCRDELTVGMLTDVNQWMMQLVCSSTSAS